MRIYAIYTNLYNLYVFELVAPIHRIYVPLFAGGSYVKLYFLFQKLRHSGIHFLLGVSDPVRMSFYIENNAVTNQNFQ